MLVFGDYDAYTVDIASVIDDVRIWRTIINGYPYKSAKELGVANDLDAFQATKQAVYCILYNFDPYTKFRSAEQGADSRGAAIRNAIINMVNEGRNGTQTPYTSGISISKVGDLTKDSEYYSQEFKINCGVEASEYTIVATEGMPNGAIITNTSGTQQTTFSASENFKVKIPDVHMQNDINITFWIKGKAKTYPVFYGKTRIANTQNYAVTFDPLGDVVGVGNLNVKTNTGSIQINKTDDETNQAISGVTFKLSKTDGTIISKSTTDNNGIATFSGLYEGKYILQEIAANKNYILNNKEIDVNVKYNETTTVDVSNEHKKGNLKIYKVDKDNHKITLGNVTFDLYSEEFQKVIGNYATNVNGEIEIDNLRIGNYKLIEKSTGKWYNLADDKEIKIEWNKTFESLIENELQKGQIKVIKIDKDNNEVKLKGVKFDVLDEKGNVLQTITTNEKGEAYTARYAIRDYPKLTIREKETLNEYVLSEEKQTLELKENEITWVTFENEIIKGYLEITKVDSKTKEALKGATFGIYDMEDNEIAKITTDKTGKAKSELIPYGKYYVKELDTGSIFYLLNENKFEFEITKNHETVPLTIENDSVNIEVTVDKEGTREIKPGEQVNYTFSNIGNNSNVYLENFKWFDYIPTDYIRLEKMTTGTWNQDLTYDVYYKTNKSEDYILRYKDLSTTENHLLDFTTQIELEDDEYITETMFDFGKVDVGFKKSTLPTMECKSFDTLKENDIFTNHTKTVGMYLGVVAEANSKWSTITHIPEEKHEVILPKTGN